MSVALFFMGCVKNTSCEPRSVESEENEMLAFATRNNLSVTRHSSGVYYQVLEQGSGATPTINSRISIIYSGQFLDGTVFDEQTTANNTPANPAWPLNSLIQGWQIGLPLIQKGGRIRLIIPSSYGYGCNPYFSIPGNSILYFEVQLVDVL